MSKRKRGGGNKPVDPSKSAAPAPTEPTKTTPDAAPAERSTLRSRAEAPRVSTRADDPPASTGAKPAARKAASPGAARAPTPTEPPAVQGKPIKIANLRVPPLPQLDTRAGAGNGSRAEPRAATPPKPSTPSASSRPLPARAPEGALRPTRSSTRPPPAPEPVPAAKQVEPTSAPVEPAAVKAPVEPAAVKAPVEPAAVKAPVEPAAVKAPVEPAAVKAPVEPARAATHRSPAHDSHAEEARGSTNTLDLRAQNTRADDAADAPPVDASAVAAGDARRDGALMDSAAATLIANTRSIAPNLHLVDGKTPVNGAIFEGGSDEDIWTEGIENTASAASALPADKAHEYDDAGSHAPAARLARGSTGDRAREAAAFGSSQSLLSTDYYFRQYGAHGLRSLATEVDDFGFDPHVDAKVRPLLETLCKRYFRVELEGAEQVPERGRALLVANRSGALPWDGLVLRTALRSARPGLSPLRWLAEDSVIHYPFMGVFMNRLGAVRACPENAERLLTQDRLVAVFPEGAQGSRKLFRDRYRLQRFGRGGYVKLALKLGVPILPTAIIGAEETNPVLGRSRLLGRFVGSDSVPITPTFPWLGLAGLLPAPVRWRIVVGAPIDLSAYGPESAEDALVVHRLNEQIRSSLQTLVDQSKQQRGSALFG